MNETAFLMLWNPFEDPMFGVFFADQVKRLIDGEDVEVTWRVPFGDQEEGDLFFMKCGIRGVNPGIFAKGTCLGSGFKNGGDRFVKLKIDSILPPGREFSYELITKTPPFDDDNIGSHQGSGRKIKIKSTEYLLQHWPTLGAEDIATLPKGSDYFLPKSLKSVAKTPSQS